ncbi:MAG: ATP-binding protein [Acidobacteria bacterium]|nr:ATP-binding protein [Acidobacteriota bacterium]
MATRGCPCGYFGDPTRECTCTMQMIQRYVAKISDPLMDRIDIHIDVPAVRVREISRPSQAESSSAVRERVVKARRAPHQRFIIEGSEHIESPHFSEAIQYRSLDRTYWK